MHGVFELSLGRTACSIFLPTDKPMLCIRPPKLPNYSLLAAVADNAVTAWMEETDEDPLSSNCQTQDEGDVTETSHEYDSGYFSLPASVKACSNPLRVQPVFVIRISSRALRTLCRRCVQARLSTFRMIMELYQNVRHSRSSEHSRFSCWLNGLPERYNRLRPFQSTFGALNSTSLHGLSQGQFSIGSSVAVASELQSSSFASYESVMVEGEQEIYTEWSMEETVQRDRVPGTLVPMDVSSADYFSEEVQAGDQRVSQLTTMGQYPCNDSVIEFIDLECTPVVEMVGVPELTTLQQEESANAQASQPLSESTIGLELFSGEIPGSPVNETDERSGPVESFQTPKKSGVFPQAGMVRTPTPVKRAYAAAERRYGKIDRELLVIPPTDEDIRELVSSYGIAPASSRRKCLFPYVCKGPEALYPPPVPCIESEDLPDDWLEIATGATAISKHMFRLAENVLRKSQG
ncbi:Cmyb C domain containing protein [Trichuris trichiura]|uniref:Cmyb C domain containing protein n=1 Tax=Trichuris trichiura TaxID=36087 RepID=A0A077ZM68_TRITR|nr:Cmyb C domain containing protein [Trichuris trichiura]